MIKKITDIFSAKTLTVFNLMVIAGIVINFTFNSLVHNQWPPGFIKSIGFSVFAFRAGLNEIQIQNIRQSREKFFTEAAEMNGEISRAKMALVDLVTSPSPDSNKIEKARQNLQEKQADLQKKMIRQILYVRSQLNDTQQEIFLQMLSKGLGSNKMHPLNENF